MAEIDNVNDIDQDTTQDTPQNPAQNFRKGETDAHNHLNAAFLYVLDMIVASASGGIAERARELALEAREMATSAKDLAEYTLGLLEELIESIGDGEDEGFSINMEAIADLQNRLSILEDDVALITFEMAMNGLLDGARNVFVDRIDSLDAVIINSGIYANNKVFI